MQVCHEWRDIAKKNLFFAKQLERSAKQKEAIFLQMHNYFRTNPSYPLNRSGQVEIKISIDQDGMIQKKFYANGQDKSYVFRFIMKQNWNLANEEAFSEYKHATTHPYSNAAESELPEKVIKTGKMILKHLNLYAREGLKLNHGKPDEVSGIPAWYNYVIEQIR